MKCPSCGENNNQIYDSRYHTQKVKWRRRKCICGHRFTTYEIPEETYNNLLEKSKYLDQLVTAWKYIVEFQPKSI